MDEVRVKSLIKNYIRDNLKVETNVGICSISNSAYNIRVSIALLLNDEVISIVDSEDELDISRFED